MQSTDVTLNYINFTPPATSPNVNTPTEHYDIISNEEKVGVINFKLSHAKRFCLYLGQISYTVFNEHQGHRFASKALSKLLPHCHLFFPDIFITCEVDNIASQKTIESVNATYLSTVDIPTSNILYENGQRKLHRYSVKR